MTTPYLITPNISLNPVNKIHLEDVASQLISKPVKLKAPIYKQRQFTQVSGGTDLNLGANSFYSNFIIPDSSVINFSRGYLAFDLETIFNIDGLANDGLVGCISAFTDSFPIESIELKTRSGESLAFIENAQLYSKIAHPMVLSLEEYNSRGPVFGDNGTNPEFPLSLVNGCHPVIVPPDNIITAAGSISLAQFTAAAATTAVGINPQPVTIANPMVVGVNLTNVSRYRVNNEFIPRFPSECYIRDVDGTSANCLPSEFPATQEGGTDVFGRGAMQHLITTDVGLAAGNLPENTADIKLRFRYPLKAFSGSIFAVDKNFYFGQELDLIIKWRSLDNLLFVNADLTGSAGGAATSLTAFAFNANNELNIDNFHLYLCEDINPINKELLKQQVNNGGIEMFIPYVTSSRKQLVAGVNPLFQLLKPADGSYLKRCLTVVQNRVDTLDMTSNIFNVCENSGVKWTRVRSLLDTFYLQDHNLSMKNSEVWSYMYDMLRGSPLGASPRTFEENCFFMDNFSDADRTVDFPVNDCKVSGLEITKPIVYSVELDSTGAVSQGLAVQFFVWLRKLIIKPGGISFY